MKTLIQCFVVTVFMILHGISYAQPSTLSKLDYPEIQNEVKKQTHYGKTVLEDYSNLNSLEEPNIQKWFRTQDSLSEQYFCTNAFMSGYLKRFENLQNRGDSDISMMTLTEKGSWYYLKYDTEIENNKVFYREEWDKEEQEILIDINFNFKDNQITYMKPSFDGSKIAIGHAMDDNFSTIIKIFDIKTNAFLKDEVSNLNPDYGDIQWLPDSSGFIYLYFPNTDRSSPHFKKQSFSALHILGTNTDTIKPIFGRNDHLNISSDFYPKVRIGSSSDKYIIGYAASSDDYYDGYIATVEHVLEGNSNWIPFFTRDDKVYYDQGEVLGNQFIFRQGDSEGNLLARVNIQKPNFQNPEVLAKGKIEDPIVNFAVTKNHIYFTKSLYGGSIDLYKISENEQVEQVLLPFKPGSLSFFSSSTLLNILGVAIDGWTSDYSRYALDKEGDFHSYSGSKTIEYPEFQDIVSEQIMVDSHDGIEVPVSLVYKKGIKNNSSNEVFIYVYGAYGESISPFFSPIFLDWAAQGGILVFPHVRGGGEKGKDWHTQGMKTLKYNSWKDLIAVTEYLIDRKYTRKGLISLYTSSAGGITAGMAINERPELYSSFIAMVPRLNPYGLESSQTASSTSYLEYGTLKDSTEFAGLLKMDPYLNLKPDVSYPAVLIMPSYNDDRIPLWDNGKYIAKLQKYNSSFTPILMDIDYNAGHESYQEYDEIITLYSKVFSFAKSNMKP